MNSSVTNAAPYVLVGERELGQQWVLLHVVTPKRKENPQKKKKKQKQWNVSVVISRQTEEFNEKASLMLVCLGPSDTEGNSSLNKDNNVGWATSKTTWFQHLYRPHQVMSKLVPQNTNHCTPIPIGYETEMSLTHNKIVHTQ